MCKNFIIMFFGKIYLIVINLINGIYLFNIVFVVIKEVYMFFIGDRF